MNMFTRKRSRDEFSDSVASENQIETDQKKPRPLPFRASPTSKHTSSFSQHHQFLPRPGQPTLTPVESSDDDDDYDKDAMVQCSPKARQGSRPPTLPFLHPRVERHNTSTDSDFEMMDSEPLRVDTMLSPWSAGITNGGHLAPSPIPGHLINQSLNISGGRTATPIYGHFTKNMDPNVMMQDASPAVALPPWGTVSSPLPTAAESDWWRKRRLPSPISESEDSLASPAGYPAGQLQVPNKVNMGNIHGGGSPLASPYPMSMAPDKDRPSLPQIITSNADENSLHQSLPGSDTEAPVPPDSRLAVPHTLGSDSLPANVTTPAPPARPRGLGARSGGKVGFSMGYRADCDKCLRKVPGHYSHIIRA